ncbi:phycobilisome linker polypeptide [Geminocystis sp. NIES-3709]|uniref:phycobilisome linker polypeptide n=1 Tax=Geminocystis sp. NIES-3709 TaxID=1617448 RepID=UPI0005FCA7F9|nr:phycobilisome linker polypeptide [Geminocystis sp. NIES-3709]BAQ66746.1 ferredoxin-NADP(+) reductase [Geminocystis sp. NIES-3709]
MRNSKTVKTFAYNPTVEERLFLFEVTGITNQRENNLNYPIRQSGNTFIAVPYSSMNKEMNRINRLGGEIVNISSIGVVAPLVGASNAQSEA